MLLGRSSNLVSNPIIVLLNQFKGMHFLLALNYSVPNSFQAEKIRNYLTLFSGCTVIELVPFKMFRRPKWIQADGSEFCHQKLNLFISALYGLIKSLFVWDALVGQTAKLKTEDFEQDEKVSTDDLKVGIGSSTGIIFSSSWKHSCSC